MLFANKRPQMQHRKNSIFFRICLKHPELQIVTISDPAIIG
jgi:hypothetical protein